MRSILLLLLLLVAATSTAVAQGEYVEEGWGAGARYSSTNSDGVYAVQGDAELMAYVEAVRGRKQVRLSWMRSLETSREGWVQRTRAFGNARLRVAYALVQQPAGQPLTAAVEAAYTFGFPDFGREQTPEVGLALARDFPLSEVVSLVPAVRAGAAFPLEPSGVPALGYVRGRLGVAFWNRSERFVAEVGASRVGDRGVLSFGVRVLME